MGWLADRRLKSLHSPEADKRSHAVAWLGGRLEPERVVLLVESADDAEKAVRAEAARALGTCGERLVWRAERRADAAGSVSVILDRLLAAVVDPEISVRLDAVKSLERIAAAAVACGRTGLVAARLAARLLDSSEEVRWQASAMLEKMDWSPSSDEERGALDIARKRWRATAAHVPALLNALTADRGYGAQYARAMAAEQLGESRDPRAYEPLHAALVGDEEDRVRSAAAGALGLLGDRRAVPALIAALEDGDMLVRNRAAMALADLGVGEAVDPLIALLGRDRYSTAVMALARLGDARAAPAIVSLLDDEDGNTRRAAAEALEKLGDPRGAEALAAEQQRELAARPDLLGLIILFNRDFAPRETFVDSILDRMNARGRAYRGWMAADTPLRVMTNPNAQDPSAIAATGLIGFRSLLGIEPDLDKLEYATFEGSDGISGSILSLWRT